MSEPFETPDIATLRARGSAKWTAFPGTIGAFVAEMDFGVAPVVRDAMTEAIDRGFTGYLSSTATSDLLEATAAWSAARYGWAIEPTQVRVVADVLTGLEVVLREFSDPAKAVIVPTPTYMPFLQIERRWGRRIVEVPSPEVDGRYELDLDGIAAAFEAGADVLVLCNPWNPTGRVLTREELVAVSEVVDRFGGRVFSDEIHAPLVLGDHVHVPYASVNEVAAAHTITATSSSKAFNTPGLKCGQLVLSNDADALRYDEVAGHLIHGAGTLGVVAGTAAYRDGGPWLDAVREYLAGNLARLGELLPEVPYREPEGTYIAWLDVRGSGLDAAALRERSGVALTDGAACGAPGFVRLIAATPRPILEDAATRIAAALA